MAKLNITVDMLKKQRKRAQAERDAHQPLLDEVYDHVMPYRRSTWRNGKGDKRVNQIFDQTAPVAAMRAAGKLAEDLFGPNFFRLEPGPVLKVAAKAGVMAGGGDPLKPLWEQLASITDRVAPGFATGRVETTTHEVAIDLQAGTGAELMLEGSEDEPLLLMSASIEDVLLLSDWKGDVVGIFWTRMICPRELLEIFPNAKLGEKAKEALKSDPEKELKVAFDTIRDGSQRGPRAKPWRFCVWIDADDAIVHEGASVTCPWNTPRFYRVPGETYGRGPQMLGMPTTMTLNMVQQLTLQGAQIAMTGIYTAVDDGVFNPDACPVEPGAIWKVSRNGGAMGPSVQRFPDPRIDLSQLIIDKLQMSLREVLNDQALPPDAAAVRSATEIVERIKRLASDNVGAFGRLVSEWVVPRVRRALEIYYNLGLLEVQVPLSELLVRVRVVSPLAQARQAAQLKALTDYLQLLLMLDPAGALLKMMIRLVPALLEIARGMGVPEDLLTSDEERQAADEAAAPQAQMAQMAALAPAAKDLADAGAAVAQIPVEPIEQTPEMLV